MCRYTPAKHTKTDTKSSRKGMRSLHNCRRFIAEHYQQSPFIRFDNENKTLNRLIIIEKRDH